MPALNLEQFPEHLRQITPNEWNDLFRFIPLLKAPDRNSVVIGDFANKAYDMQLIISFDWFEWTEGRSLLESTRKTYADLDAVTLCKMLTVLIRQDRFVEGLLEGCVANGTVPGILEGLQSKVGL